MSSFYEKQSTAGTIFSASAYVADPRPIPSTQTTIVLDEQITIVVDEQITIVVDEQITIVVDKQSGDTRNVIYDAAELYLPTLISPDRFKVKKNPKQKNISVSMVRDQQVVDNYRGFKLTWQQVEAENQIEKRFFELTFNKRHKDTVMNEYLPFVLEKAKEIEEKVRDVIFYTWIHKKWDCMDLDHPMTFDKLAMDPKLKMSILEDLDRFLGRREYYKGAGKAWMRCYLLYGPPGSDKPSLIAAMANYLKFDIYHLKLNDSLLDSAASEILHSTTKRSIIVTEVCEKDVMQESSNTKRSLSNLLNCIDGFWSTYGDEKIIIFAIDHEGELDPALICPVRVDMHIHMGYCTPEGFDLLAYNYLGIREHAQLFPLIKEKIQKTNITHAVIVEHLMRSENSDLALKGLLEFLIRTKKDRSEDDRNSDIDVIKLIKDIALNARENKIKNINAVTKPEKRITRRMTPLRIGDKRSHDNNKYRSQVK